MKLIRKKRISIDNLESLKNKKGIIFVSSSYNCYSNKKPINLVISECLTPTFFTQYNLASKGKVI